MPSITKICNKPGCGKLTQGKYCHDHANIEAQYKKEQEQKRESASKRGYGYKWQKVRLSFLAKHPLCIACHSIGKVTLANVVDHITPHKGNKDLFWNRANWQSLCKPCHDAKTARENGGFNNPVKQ